MAEPVKTKRKFGRFEYDPMTGTYVAAALIFAAVVLATLAYNQQGSPQMDDKAALQQGATIPNPTQLSPPATSGAAR